MRVLVLGAGGQLGRLVVQQAPLYVKVSAYASQVCDISDLKNLRSVIDKTAPELVINCAAFTNVDQAESDPERAHAVNALGVENLVAATREATRLLHISTDFVFDGKSVTPYKTTAPTNPLCVYGASKLAGENILLEQAPERSTIVRTAWLYAAEGHNFMNTMLRLMQSRDEVKVVADQRGTPTAAHGLAKALWAFAGKPEIIGLQHWTDAGEASWHDFACEIQKQALEKQLLQKTVPILPISTAEFSSPVERPVYSVLDKTATWNALKLQGQPWQLMLGEVLDQLKRINFADNKSQETT
jgi:dTDP-4-dehydrorhamnose reductase